MNAYQQKNSGTAGGYSFLAVLIATVALSVVQMQVGSAALLSDDFPGATLDPAWVAGGPGSTGWSHNGYGAVQSDDTIGGAPNHTTLTRALSTPTSEWTVDLRYGWLGGTGAGGARDAFKVLDASGSGYAVYVDQASGGDIGIEKYTLGVYAGGSYALRPFADTGLDLAGALTAIRLVWDPGTGLDLYLATAPGGSTLDVTPIVTWADTTYSASSFTQFQLGNINAGGYQSVFDDVNVTNLAGVPEPTSIALVACGMAVVLIRRRSVKH